MANAQEKLEKGYIQSKVIIEILGKPKEHIEQTLKGYVEHIKKNKDYELLNADFEEAKELEGENKGLWISFVEVEFLTKDIISLVGFCFDYMPSSIEIIAPAEFRIKEREFSNIMNDLQGKLHKLDMMAKQLTSENQLLQRNTYFLATNLVAVLMKSGARKLKDLSKASGMSEKDLNEFLEKLIKQGHIQKEGDSYTWVTNDKRKK